MRREGEPQGSRCDERVDVEEKKEMGRESPEIKVRRAQVAVVETDNMADLVLQGGTTITNLVRYQYKVGNNGRWYSSPLGAQRCSNLVRAHVLPPATEDFDMVNAMTSLVVQAVRKTDLAAVTQVEQLVRQRRPHHGDPWTVAGFPGREDEGGHPLASPTGVPSPTLNTRNPRIGLQGVVLESQGCCVELRAPILVSFTTGSSRG